MNPITSNIHKKRLRNFLFLTLGLILIFSGSTCTEENSNLEIEKKNIENSHNRNNSSDHITNEEKSLPLAKEQKSQYESSQQNESAKIDNSLIINQDLEQNHTSNGFIKQRESNSLVKNVLLEESKPEKNNDNKSYEDKINFSSDKKVSIDNTTLDNNLTVTTNTELNNVTDNKETQVTNNKENTAENREYDGPAVLMVGDASKEVTEASVLYDKIVGSSKQQKGAKTRSSICEMNGKKLMMTEIINGIKDMNFDESKDIRKDISSKNEQIGLDQDFLNYSRKYNAIVFATYCSSYSVDQLEHLLYKDFQKFNCKKRPNPFNTMYYEYRDKIILVLKCSQKLKKNYDKNREKLLERLTSLGYNINKIIFMFYETDSTYNEIVSENNGNYVYDEIISMIKTNNMEKDYIDFRYGKNGYPEELNKNRVKLTSTEEELKKSFDEKTNFLIEYTSKKELWFKDQFAKNGPKLTE